MALLLQHWRNHNLSIAEYVARDFRELVRFLDPRINTLNRQDFDMLVLTEHNKLVEKVRTPKDSNLF